MLRNLLNVCILNRNGYRVAAIDQLEEDQINDLVKEILSEPSPEYQNVIDALLMSMIRMNESEFQSIFEQHVERLGMEATFKSVIYPFLNQVGIWWGINKALPAQEHFITSLIRQKLVAAIDYLPASKPTAPKLLLFLPEEEFHEIGLLLSYYLAKAAGWQVVYLGQHVPLINISESLSIAKPDLMMTIITAPRAEEPEEFLSAIRENTDIPIVIGGPSPIIELFESDARVTILYDPGDFHDFLNQVKAKIHH